MSTSVTELYKEFKSLPDTTTPIDAENLNQMQKDIKSDIGNNRDSLQTDINNLNNNMNTLSKDLNNINKKVNSIEYLKTDLDSIEYTPTDDCYIEVIAYNSMWGYDGKQSILSIISTGAEKIADMNGTTTGHNTEGTPVYAFGAYKGSKNTKCTFSIGITNTGGSKGKGIFLKIYGRSTEEEAIENESNS